MSKLIYKSEDTCTFSNNQSGGTAEIYQTDFGTFDVYIDGGDRIGHQLSRKDIETEEKAYEEISKLSEEFIVLANRDIDTYQCLMPF